MAWVELHDAEANLSALVDKAAEGCEVVIMRNGKPVAQLIPMAGRRFGTLKGKVWIADDFDAPLELGAGEADRR